MSENSAISPDRRHHVPEPLLDKLAKEGVWFYGVIAALAVEKAVEGFLHGFSGPWIIDPTHPLSSAAENGPGLTGHLLEFLRVVVLLIMAVRFYLGAVWLFHQHVNGLGRKGVQATDAWRRARHYRNDFVIGIFHFVLFFGWSLTITIHRVLLSVFSPYFVFLMLILVWDLFYPWGEFRDYIKRNLRIAGVSLGVLVGLRLLWGPGAAPWAEGAALLPALIMSLWELRKHFQQAISEHPSAKPSERPSIPA